MKKILSFLLALTIVITSFAFVGTTVSADSVNISATHIVEWGVGSKTGDFQETLTDYLGKSNVKHFGRAGSQNTFMDLVVDTTKLETGKYYVAEASVIFGENIERIGFLPGKSSVLVPGTTEDIAGYVVLNSLKDGIIRNGWNDIRVVFNNVVRDEVIVYINQQQVGVFEQQAEFTTSNDMIRFGFEHATKKKPEEVWVDVDSLKVLKVSDPTTLFEFNKANGSALIMSDDSNPGVISEVYGLYGRDVNDMSYYFKYSNAKASGSGYMKFFLDKPLNSMILDNHDVIVETSVLLPNKSTRIDVLGSGDTVFYKAFSGEVSYGQWIKVVLIFDFESGIATVYRDGEYMREKPISSYNTSMKDYAEREIKILFSKVESEAYINSLKIYQAPHGTVSGIEAKGLTEESTLASGYRVDFGKNVIYTTNDITGLTIDALKANLGVAEDVAVRAYADTDAKCETPLTNIEDGCKIAVESSTGIIQLLTLRQVELDVNASGVATLNPKASVSGVLLVAAYDENGKLIKIDNLPVSGSATLTSTVEGAYKYKAFVFDSITTAKPLVESASSR